MKIQAKPNKKRFLPTQAETKLFDCSGNIISSNVGSYEPFPATKRLVSAAIRYRLLAQDLAEATLPTEGDIATLLSSIGLARLTRRDAIRVSRDLRSILF